MDAEDGLGGAPGVRCVHAGALVVNQAIVHEREATVLELKGHTALNEKKSLKNYSDIDNSCHL